MSTEIDTKDFLQASHMIIFMSNNLSNTFMKVLTSMFRKMIDVASEGALLIRL